MNKRMLAGLRSEKVELPSQMLQMKVVALLNLIKKLPKKLEKLNLDCSRTAGLEAVLTLAIGARVMLRRNIDVTMGLVKVVSSEFYFHKPITVHIELYLYHRFIHFLLYIGQY